MACQPLVSIITPCFNSAAFLRETYESVKSQTMTDWEMLIVDDGSTDDSLAIARTLESEDPRVRVFALPKNYGRPHQARNVAIDEGQGAFLAFLDSDDLWLPEKLEKQIEFMEQNSAALSFTQYRRFSSDQQTPGKLITVPRIINYKDLLKHNVIACLTAMIDRRKTGPIKMQDYWLDDFLLWLEITKRGMPAHGLDMDLARYRVGQSSMSKNKLRAAYRTWVMYRRPENLSVPKALYYFSHYVWNTTQKHKHF